MLLWSPPPPPPCVRFDTAGPGSEADGAAPIQAPLTAPEAAALNATATRRNVRVAVVLTVRRPEDAALWGTLAGWAAQLPWLSLRLHATAVAGHRLQASKALPEAVAWLKAGSAAPVRAYVCGPGGFFEAVAGVLAAQGLCAADMFTEAFLF